MPLSTDAIERRLILLATGFLGIYSLAITLSAAARLRTWQVSYPWQHWLGFAFWAGLAWLTHQQLSRHLPGRDPFLFPAAATLTGWGVLTIWRLSGGLGLRQTAWLLLIGILLLAALHFDHSQADSLLLSYLHRFKYVWLTSGLLLTAATLVLGTNPMGGGPRLWLGCCGFYFQPSEPLKLLLIVYLAAYLADRQASVSTHSHLLPLLTPTLIMTGLAMLLLVFQRDLGTAAIFLVLYAVIVYTGTSNYRVLLLSLLVLILASAAGYALFDVVHLRLDAWINPWLDPSGNSYQVVQSLLALANGGLIGRGPGMGSPGLVPIAQSDFIFAAITEETGMLGAFGILALLGLLLNRGIRSAMQTSDPFRRLLATGLVAHLVGQSILIIGGNLRLLPLTGVTLPFVSYGGSSLLVSFFELFCLLVISASPQEVLAAQPEQTRQSRSTSLLLSGGLLLGLAGAALAGGWWGIVRAPALLTRTDNPRRSIADRYVKRGTLLDRHDQVLAESTGQPGGYVRQYPYPALGPLVGYTDPTYGQAGLEASLDPYLRGLQGYPTLTLWWEHLLYGQPPAGLDVRLSLDLDLQTQADRGLASDPGALVLLNANTGELLALASSPSFDANQLETDWPSLVNDPNSPLYDRPAMGLYPAGSLLGAFLLTNSQPASLGESGGLSLAQCALSPVGHSLGELVAAGCPAATRTLANSLPSSDLLNLLDQLGLYTAPEFPVETLTSSRPVEISNAFSYISGTLQLDNGASLKISPLQMALAAASLSSQGQRPAPRLVVAVNTPRSGWVMLPVSSQPQPVFPLQAARNAMQALADSELPIWQAVSADIGGVSIDQENHPGYAWYIGGTLPTWQGAPVAIAVLLEQNNPQRALQLGKSLLQAAIQP